MRQENIQTTSGSPPPRRMRSEEARLIQQLRQGDAEAGHQFVRDYYPDVYRYLLYLTGRSEMAEDLTQETFIQAWRGLHAFEGRASLRVWLHRIARREFLQVLRSQRPQASLEDVTELVTAPDAHWVDAVELRDVIRKLPPEQAEVAVLHYLQGYTCAEIARIVGAHVSTVKYRLSVGRLHLERELGEGDLLYLNEPSVPMRPWGWLPLDEMYALATRLTSGGSADREGRGPRATMEDTMERREFLRQAAVGAAGLMLPEAEKEVVDSRLTQRVNCAFKGTALSDLCDQLHRDTGIQLTAGPSVADEKVTLFCKRMPLRETMRQLARPFGYAWLRSGTPGEYRYELVQDLRSQLLEEELRNRDRNEALLALEREIERFRPYLHLSPDEALARASTAAPADKALLEKLAWPGWGALQMFPRLSAQEHAALRAGQELTFSEAPRPGEHPLPEWLAGAPLPTDMGRGVLQSMRTWRLVKSVNEVTGAEGYEYTPDETAPGALPPSAIPSARGFVRLRIKQGELGQFTLESRVGLFTVGSNGDVYYSGSASADSATGTSLTIRQPDVSRVNAQLSRDPALRDRVTVEPDLPTSRSPRSAPRVTTADVLEALHHATGMSIVADFYTRLYQPQTVTVRDMPLFDALNQLSDALRLRWRKEPGGGAGSPRSGGPWLQFRSVTYYDDRLKEVPNRLLARWSEARRHQGALMLDHVCEIAQLPDAQLDGAEMAEGARELFGLAEWDLARSKELRPHLRYLATFTPEQRQEAMSAAGLPFGKMSLAQQQRFLSEGLRGAPLQSLEELAGAVLRVEYTRPGGFQWGEPGWSSYYTRWVVPLEPGLHGKRVPRPSVQEPTRKAALAAVCRVDPRLREALLQAVLRADPRVGADARAFEEAQLFPTRLGLAFVYIPGATNQHPIFVRMAEGGASGQCHYRQR